MLGIGSNPGGAADLCRGRPDPGRQRQCRRAPRSPSIPASAARSRRSATRCSTSTGAFAATQKRLTDEAAQISKDSDALSASSDKYYNQLLTSFTAMDRQVSAFKATQAYLEQQVQMWTNSKN